MFFLEGGSRDEFAACTTTCLMRATHVVVGKLDPCSHARGEERSDGCVRAASLLVRVLLQL